MKQCNFLHRNCNFSLPEKECFWNAKKLHCLADFRPHLGAVHLVHWSCHDVVQNSDTSSEDTTSEQSKQARTMAQQPRYTDARATPHMTPTSMEVDSYTR